MPDTPEYVVAVETTRRSTLSIRTLQITWLKQNVSQEVDCILEYQSMPRFRQVPRRLVAGEALF